MATITALAGLQTIPLELIARNPFNPRKHFEKGPLQELADSIKVHGVRQPILVRPIPPGHFMIGTGSRLKDGPLPKMPPVPEFQLVVGERRWRASKLAGKADIPAIVDPNLDDRSALEIMVIENLQREDVHPLDEALGYQCLMEHHCSKCGRKNGHKLGCSMSDVAQEDVTVEAIAAKVGKSVGYVYARMKLLSLIPAGREGFRAGRITAGHAVLIARLQPRDQIKALGACFNEFNIAEDLKDNDPQNIKFGMIVFDGDRNMGAEPGLISEKALREWIQDNVNLRLKDVPWDLADAQLFSEAGACLTCQKRSTSNPALFAELAFKGEDTCFDAACYGKKREAFVKITLAKDKKRAQEANAATAFPAGEQGVVPHERIRQISEQTAYTAPKQDQLILKQGQWLAAKKDECPSVEEALIVNGANAGVRRLVCCNGKCKVHKHHFQEPMSGSSSSRSEDPAAKAKWEAKQRVNDQLVVEILKAAVKQLKKPEVKTILFLAELAAESVYGGEELTFAVMGAKTPKELDAIRKKASIQQAMGFLLLGILGDQDYLDCPAMKLAIKLGKVDVSKLRKELEKKDAALQTSAQHKAKAAAKGK